MMKVLHTLLLISLPLVIDPYQVKFQTSSHGFQFSPSIASNPISIRTRVSSLTRCAMLCARETDCQTVDFDHLSLQCRLFSQWKEEGTFLPSPTSKTAYIRSESTFYALYNQTCRVTEEENRFLTCQDGRWACQTNYFWNGTACARGRTFNVTCRNNDWCDRTRYLICLNVNGRCGCNHSMTWTGIQCTPICPQGQMGMTFDDLSNRTDNFFSPIPSSYAGFRWEKAYLTMPMPNETGYLSALRSGQYVAFKSGGETLKMDHLTKVFTVHTLFVAAAYTNGISAEFKASPNGYQKTITLNTYNGTLVTLNWANIDQFEIRSSSGINDHIALDNLCVTL